jgi:hypothetical protein
MGMEKYSGEERRKFVRIPFEAVTRYSVRKDKSKKECAKGGCPDPRKAKRSYASADAKNVSTGGILLATKEHFPLHAILEIEMDVPSMDGYTTVKILGEIVRTTAMKNGELYDNGISFYKIKDEDRETIEELLEFCPASDEIENE